jgi:anti-anti-sigma regulatory factor
MPVETGPDSVVWSLPTIVNIYGVAGLKTDLRAALAQRRDIRIRLDEVEEFDGAGVQLLLAAKLFSERQACSITLEGHKPAVSSALGTMGLGSLMGDAL